MINFKPIDWENRDYRLNRAPKNRNRSLCYARRLFLSFLFYLDGGFKFKSSFPNLRDVEIKLENEIRIKYRFDMWKNCLKSVGIARSVRQLEYFDDCGFKKEQLKKTFPKASWARTPSPDLTDTSPPPSDEDSSDSDY